MQAMVLDTIRSSVRALDSAIPRFDRRDAATVKLPILLVGGANSQRYFSHINRLLALSLPACTEVVTPDAFHNVPLEKPQEFNKATSDFLNKG
jgi:pimeloyl-ACP methyl ester carboxylesterase